ncbi:hypothetical protein [Embleya sp. NPDC005971]|uniref:hypothetical protein n=1 Tax=Embleya sp. NPDC005971 TaxID=3156724 RepID=UPI0033F1E42B
MTTYAVTVRQHDYHATAGIPELGLTVDIDHPYEAEDAIREALALHGHDPGAALAIEYPHTD